MLALDRETIGLSEVVNTNIFLASYIILLFIVDIYNEKQV